MSICKSFQQYNLYLFYCNRNLTEKQRQLVEELAKEERGKDDKDGFSDKEEADAASAWGWWTR